MEEADFARLIEEKLDDKLKDYPTRVELKEEIAKAVAPLATKTELQEAVAHFDTRWAETTADIKHHVNIVAESLRDEIKIVADAVMAVNERLDRSIDQSRHRLDRHEGQLDRLDIRVTRLEERSGLDRP